jgi:hypothetical protein
MSTGLDEPPKKEAWRSPVGRRWIGRMKSTRAGVRIHRLAARRCIVPSITAFDDEKGPLAAYPKGGWEPKA